MVERVALALVFCLISTRPSVAIQSSSPAVSERYIAAARAQADRIIARGDAGAYFENITDDVTATVRHKNSGMTCAFYGETDYDFIRLFPKQNDDVAYGDDVMCNIRTAEMDLSTYATRYAKIFTPEFVIEDAQRAIVGRVPDAVLYEGDLSTANMEGRPPPLIAAYDITVENKPKRTFVLVAHEGEWSFKARATGERADQTLNLQVALAFMQSMPGGRALD